MIPGLTDIEAPAIAEAAVAAGARFAGYTALRLPFAVKTLFEEWLARHFPDRKEKVLKRIRAIRGGKLNDPNFATRMGAGIFDQMVELFHLAQKAIWRGRPASRQNTSADPRSQAICFNLIRRCSDVKGLETISPSPEGFACPEGDKYQR
jgi:DNA repair photolyase